MNRLKKKKKVRWKKRMSLLTASSYSFLFRTPSEIPTSFLQSLNFKHTVYELYFDSVAYCACQCGRLRSRCRRICCIVKVFSLLSPQLLLPPPNQNYSARSSWHRRRTAVLTDLVKSPGRVSLSWHTFFDSLHHRHTEACAQMDTCHFFFFFGPQCSVLCTDGLWTPENPRR